MPLVEVVGGNNLVIAPLNSVMRRFEDNNSFLKDEIDGVYIKVATGTDSIETSNVVRAILSATHKDAGDFTVVVPAGHIGLAVGSKAQKEVWPKACAWSPGIAARTRNWISTGRVWPIRTRPWLSTWDLRISGVSHSA